MHERLIKTLPKTIVADQNFVTDFKAIQRTELCKVLNAALNFSN
jgi:hypothetical protein